MSGFAHIGAYADDVASGVDGAGSTECPTNGSEVYRQASGGRPQRSTVIPARILAHADNIAVVINAVSAVVSSAE
jgi:hypothetical protein